MSSDDLAGVAPLELGRHPGPLEPLDHPGAAGWDLLVRLLRGARDPRKVSGGAAGPGISSFRLLRGARDPRKVSGGAAGAGSPRSAC